MVGGHSFGQFLDFACDRTVVLLEVFGVLKDAVEVLLCLDWMKDRKRLSVRSKTLKKISELTSKFGLNLMFLSTFAFLFNLLLFLQFLCDAGFAERLSLASLVGLGIKGGL